MKRISTLLGLAIAATTPLASFGQTVIFNDDFSGGSTLNQSPVAPTANSTSYQVAQGISGGSSSISGSGLSMTSPSTTSVVMETMGLFSATPVVLANIGDYISLSMTFQSVSSILGSGNNANSSLNIGLFNSGGQSPNQGTITLNTGTATGGAEDWLGYAGRIFVSGNANIFMRSNQVPNGTTSQNQDLLFTGASGSQTFNAPTGFSLGNTASAVTLTDASTYTLQLHIEMTGAGTLVVSNALYSGADTSGTLLFSQQKQTTTGTTYITNSFDGFAIGWRHTVGAASTSSMLIQDVQVVSNVPEPSMIALAGLGAIGLLFGRRILRR